MSLAPGTRLGPYEILAFVGAGGMGEVYRARDPRLDRDVAIKVLARQLAADPGALTRFEREARILSRLAHPNVCTVFDVGRDRDTHYLVIEFLTGRTLAAELGAGRLSLDRGLDYAIQIADGLARAHALGVIHRDLKPANLMLTEDGFVKILDFGLAKRFGAAAGEATALLSVTDGAVVGTFAYMAPEQTRGEHIDVRTDIFAFGAILYEMFAGVRPFDGGNVVSTIRRINDEEPRRLRIVRPEVPPAVEAIVERALRKDRQDRFQSAAEMRAQLRAAAGRSAASDLSAASSVRYAMPTGSARALWRSGAIALVAIALFAVAIWRFNAGQEPKVSPASAAAADLPTDSTGWARRGQRLLMRHDRRENVELAGEAFRRALELDGSSALAHAGMAEAYYRKDAATPDAQLKRLASEHARRAVEINPDLAVAHLAQAMVYLSNGQREEADRALNLASDLDPLNADVLRWRGDYYVDTDRPKAEAVYLEAVRRAPDDWRTHQWLGRFYYSNARYEDAARVWERACELTPDNVLVLRNLGGAYHALDRTDAAAAAFQRALEIEPAATTYSNLGTLRFFQGRYADSAAAFEKAVELNPTYYLYWGNLGDAYRWIPGQEGKAREAFTRGAALAEERLKAREADVSLRASLAGYLAKRGDAEKARDQLRRIEEAADRSAAVYFKTALAYEITGDRARALRDLEVALQKGYPMREIGNEAELIELRADPRYHRMLARLEQ